MEITNLTRKREAQKIAQSFGIVSPRSLRLRVFYIWPGIVVVGRYKYGIRGRRVQVNSHFGADVIGNATGRISFAALVESRQRIREQHNETGKIGN